MSALLAGGATAAVVLRWYSRLFILKRTGLEDFLVPGALVSTLYGSATLSCIVLILNKTIDGHLPQVAGLISLTNLDIGY
jgi:hypothetical protein